MPIPKHVFDPPFNIVRSSHVALGVADLGRARAFYEGALGLIVEDEDTGALYLRALEERQHHSLVLTKSRSAEAASSGLQGQQRGGPRQGRALLQG
jgi:catechol 2,3-dioxygenase